MSQMSVPSHQHQEDECSRVLAHLNDYIDHDLSPELCQELEEHLANCENCRVVLDTLNQTLYFVNQLKTTQVSLPTEVEYRLFAVMHLERFLPSEK